MTSYNLIYDVSNNFHRSYGVYNYKIKDFSLENREHRNMLVRKFVVDVIAITKLVPTQGVFLCFDKFSFRKNVDSEYKANRTSSKQAFYETLDEVYDLLIFKGLNAIRVEGLEADDCIALTCEKLEHLPKIIISSDDDLKQLVRPRCYVLTPHSKNRTLYKSVYSVHHPIIDGINTEVIHPQYILAEKFLKGCKGDNVSSLVQKGFRSTKIEQFANEYQKQKMNHADTEFNSIKVASNVLGLDFTDEQILKQLQLVCLQSQFMPSDLVNQFNSIKFKENRLLDFEVATIMANTKYWDEGYKKES